MEYVYAWQAEGNIASSGKSIGAVLAWRARADIRRHRLVDLGMRPRRPRLSSIGRRAPACSADIVERQSARASGHSSPLDGGGGGGFRESGDCA